MKLAKFGGSSVASAERIKHILENIVIPDKELKYVVCSTFGKKDSSDIKITDQLEKIASKFYYEKIYPETEITNIKNKYYNETKELGLETKFLDDIFEEFEKIVKREVSDFDQYYASLVSQGERMFVSIPAAYLNKKGIKTEVVYPEKCGLLTDSNYRNAKLLDGSLENLKKYVESIDAEKFIFPGFYAIDKESDFTTFRRGGSDYTGAIVSKALNVDLYENFTDVNGILRVDPNLFSKEENICVETIKEISYREVRELAYGGAKVLHSGTLKPLEDAGIPLRIRNTFELNNLGTLVVSKKEKTYEVVKGIAARDDIQFLNVTKENMDNEVGIGYKIEKTLFDYKISFTQITSSIDSLSYAIAEPDFIDEKERKNFEDNLNSAINTIKQDDEILADNVIILKPYSLIYIVGEGMHNTLGLMSKFAKILAQNKINIYTTYQVPEQINVIFGIDKADCKKAVRELYKSLFVNQTGLHSLKNENLNVLLKSIAKKYSVEQLNQVNSNVAIEISDNKIIFEFSNIFSEAEKKFLNNEKEINDFKKMKETVIATTKNEFKTLLENSINNKVLKIYFEINYDLNEQVFFVTLENNLK